MRKVDSNKYYGVSVEYKEVNAAGMQLRKKETYIVAATTYMEAEQKATRYADKDKDNRKYTITSISKANYTEVYTNGCFPASYFCAKVVTWPNPDTKIELDGHTGKQNRKAYYYLFESRTAERAETMAKKLLSKNFPEWAEVKIKKTKFRAVCE